MEKEGIKEKNVEVSDETINENNTSINSISSVMEDNVSNNSESDVQEVIKEKIVYVEKKKSKKKLIIFLIILIILIGLFLWWWFNRKFDVTFQYNNGLEDKVVKVKYLNKIKNEDIKKDLSLANYSFVGYYETYYLNGKDIEKIKKNPDLESTICKKDFKLDNNRTKCIAINEFDFINTKIKSEKTIEALWSTITFNINPTEKQIYIGESFDIAVTLSGTNDTRVSWSSDDNGIASVNDSGHVVGNKVGKTTIVAESNGIRRTCVVSVIEKEKPKEEPKQEVKEEPKEEPKDNGTISLSGSNQCMIGSDSVTINATVNNALDDTINWSNLKCFDISKVSNNQITISRIGRGTMCRGIEELNPTITASLNNGNSDSLTFNYEFKLGVTVYDGDTEIQPRSDGAYHHEKSLKVQVNQDVFIAATGYVEIGDNYVIVDRNADSDITIKTTCGQTMNIKVIAIIN